MHPASHRGGDVHNPVDTDKIVGGSKLLGELRDIIRRKHYSIRTEQAYLNWSKRYILFHGKRHPKDMGEAQIVEFQRNQIIVRDGHPDLHPCDEQGTAGGEKPVVPSQLV